MTIVWHPKRWWDWCVSEDEKKEIEHTWVFLFMYTVSDLKFLWIVQKSLRIVQIFFFSEFSANVAK